MTRWWLRPAEAVCPLILGGGQRLFTSACAPAHLTLAETKTFDTGALLLRYEAA